MPEPEPLGPREAAIEAHLASGRSLCPYAAGARRLYVDEAQLDAGERLDRAVEVFGRVYGARPSHALIMVAADDPPFEEARELALQLYARLLDSVTRASGWRPIESLIEAERQVRMMRDPTSTLRPHIAWHDRALIVIGMGPQYPAGHPRYLPHTALVATYKDDIADAAARAPGIEKQIIAARVAAHGLRYDGDELWVPPPSRRLSRS